MRKSSEIMAEIEDLGDSLKTLLSLPNGVYVADLKFFADKIGDLKQELRISEAVENQGK